MFLACTQNPEVCNRLIRFLAVGYPAVSRFGHSCDVKANGDLACFCWNNDGECSVPSDLGPVVAVAAGAYRNCAVKAQLRTCPWMPIRRSRWAIRRRVRSMPWRSETTVFCEAGTIGINNTLILRQMPMVWEIFWPAQCPLCCEGQSKACALGVLCNVPPDLSPTEPVVEHVQHAGPATVIPEEEGSILH